MRQGADIFVTAPVAATSVSTGSVEVRAAIAETGGDKLWLLRTYVARAPGAPPDVDAAYAFGTPIPYVHDAEQSARTNTDAGMILMNEALFRKLAAQGMTLQLRGSDWLHEIDLPPQLFAQVLQQAR